MNVFLEAPLNQAYLMERKAERFLKRQKWDEAKVMYDDAAKTMAVALSKVDHSQIKDCLMYQKERFVDKCKYVDVLKSKHEKIEDFQVEVDGDYVDFSNIENQNSNLADASIGTKLNKSPYVRIEELQIKNTELKELLNQMAGKFDESKKQLTDLNIKYEKEKKRRMELEEMVSNQKQRQNSFLDMSVNNDESVVMEVHQSFSTESARSALADALNE